MSIDLNQAPGVSSGHSTPSAPSGSSILSREEGQRIGRAISQLDLEIEGLKLLGPKGTDHLNRKKLDRQLLVSKLDTSAIEFLKQQKGALEGQISSLITDLQANQEKLTAKTRESSSFEVHFIQMSEINAKLLKEIAGLKAELSTVKTALAGKDLETDHKVAESGFRAAAAELRITRLTEENTALHRDFDAMEQARDAMERERNEYLARLTVALQEKRDAETELKDRKVSFNGEMGRIKGELGKVQRAFSQVRCSILYSSPDQALPRPPSPLVLEPQDRRRKRDDEQSPVNLERDTAAAAAASGESVEIISVQPGKLHRVATALDDLADSE